MDLQPLNDTKETQKTKTNNLIPIDYMADLGDNNKINIIDSFKEWYNEDKENNNHATEDEIASVSAINNPLDQSLTDIADDLSEEYLDKDLKIDREIKVSDINNYKTNVRSVFGDKYDVGFDPDDYKPFISPKGKNDFKPVLNDLSNATTSEIGERVWANAPTWLTEIGGDIGGAWAGVKMASKFSKHPAVLALGAVSGSVFGSTAGASVGAGVQTLKADENMSNTRRVEIMKDAGLDALVGNAVAIGVVGSAITTFKGVRKISPLHSVKVGKDAYKEETLYGVEAKSANPLNKNVNRNDELKVIAEAKAQSDFIFKTFGGKKEESEIIELAGNQATKDVVRDYYAHSEKVRNATIQNSMQLTKNFQEFFKLNKQDSSDIYRFLQGGMSEIKTHYSNIYKESRDLIDETVGSQHIAFNTSTKARLETLLDDAKYPKNVNNTKIDEVMKNEFNKDYQDLLEMTLKLFDNTSGYKVSNLLDVQKRFNGFYIKHKKKFDVEQLKGLDTVKESIYADIQNGIKSSDIPGDKKVELNELWKWANDEYKNYKTLTNKKEIFTKLLDRDVEFDEMKFASDLIKNANKADKEDFAVLDIFAGELKKIDETKLDEFYKTLINSFVTTSKRTMVHKNVDVDFMDFEKFSNSFNSVDTGRMKKIFSHSPRGREIYKHLKDFDALAKREGALQKATIGDEYKMAEGQGDSRQLMQKLLYSTEYLMKSITFDWWSKYALKSKAYEDFVLTAMTKNRYEDVDQLIKRLDYEQQTIPTHRQVDTKQFKEDIAKAKLTSKELVRASKNDLNQKEVQELSLAGFIQHKPDIDSGVRNFDTEKIQVKELAAKEGLDEITIQRINNFDEFFRELKNFKQANKEVLTAEIKNPSPVGYEEKVGNEILQVAEPEVKTFVDETKVLDELNANQEDFKSFLQKNELKPLQEGEIEAPQTMLEKAMARQNFDKDLVGRIYNEPTNVLSSEAKELYKPYKDMFTTFQGGKHQMSQIVPQYLDTVYTKEQLNGVTKIVDYFGGGGTWGSFFAKIDKFPNIKDVEINEFNELRALKISYLYHRPQALIDTLQKDPLITDLIEGMKAISKDKGNNGSNGFIAPYINAMMTEYEQGVKGAVQITTEQKAALYLLADYGNASFATMDTQNIISNLTKQIDGVARAIAPLKEKGVKFNIKNRSSYEIKDYEQGSHVLAIVDPPYYLTSGYDIIKDGVMTKASVVGIDMYEETNKLLKNLNDAGNLGIYTDEAWEVKSVKLAKNFKRETVDGKSDYEVLKDISDNMGDFFRVPEKIADRTEVLGFLNSTGKKGKINGNIADSGTKPNLSNNDGIKTPNEEHPRGEGKNSGGMESRDSQTSGPSQSTQQSSDTRVDGTDEQLDYTKDADWIEANKLHAAGTDNLAVGVIAGVEEDENGDISFDAEKFVLALGGYTALKTTLKNKKVSGIFRGWASKAMQDLHDKALSGNSKAMALTGISPVAPLPQNIFPKNYKDSQGFYSVLEKAVDEKVGGKIDSSSLESLLKKAGVKDDEIEWSGLSSLMDTNQKLTKTQIDETISENRLGIKVISKDADVKYLEQTLSGAKNYKEYIFKTADTKNSFTSSHWDEKNVLVFSRVDDREIDGQKALFIEELQSDWHQAGRKEGYDANSIPDAPFKKNWHELGLKRLIQEAVANNYDKVAWTTGKQQTERYSLEKEIDTIIYNKQTGFIQGTNAGESVIFKDVANDEEVVALVGKELSARLIDAKNSTYDDIFVLKGEELKFGGEGMKTFYDSILPNTAKKLIKKYDSKLKQEELDDLEEMVWSFDVTDKMKKDVSKNGQALYVNEETVGGLVAGIETDDDGNFTGFDIENFLLGAGATHGISKALKKEKRGIFNVTHNGKNSSLIKKDDLETLNDYIKYEKGNSKKGAVHIKKHIGEGTTGELTQEELLDIGMIIRDGQLSNSYGKNIYEFHKDDVRYRVITSKEEKERVITFYSDRNLPNKEEV